jgi:hypothetical protein
MHDSVYAFDAESNQGPDASPLWQVNFLDPANGITTVPVADENCNVTGYTEFGIQGTPAIDLSRNAIYVLAMTKENGNYVHKLHALDLWTGAELFDGPVTVTASFFVNDASYPFVDRYQQQRPGLLLQNGNIYIAFGGPGCNIKTEMGWVLAYDGATLQQIGAFNVSPGVDASAIWMSGAGLAGDGDGNVYFSTGDGLFDGPGGTHFGDTVLKLTQVGSTLALGDYFTPYNQLFFQQNDLDVSSGLVMLVPEQGDGKFTLAIDKNGTAYVLDQDNMGGYDPAGDYQIPQELDIPVSGEVHAGLTYWDNNVYVAAEQTPIQAYSFTNGQLSLTPTSRTPKATANPTGGIVSANGEQDAIYWYVTFPTNKLFAFDATNLAVELYDNGMAGNRDAMGPMVHFGMPTVANGRVYVNGKTELSVFGLLPAFAPVGGNNQTGVVGTTLALPLQAGLQDPYSGKAIATAGIPVTFKAIGNLGSFSNPTVNTDASGNASTSYTLPAKPGTYTITASSPGYVSAVFTVTATLSGPVAIVISSGNQQNGPVASPLAAPLQVKVKDSKGYGVPGVSVSFNDGGDGGLLSPTTAQTDLSGFATTSYTTGTKTGTIHISASVSGLPSVTFRETAVAGIPASLAIHSGNNQTVAAGSTTRQMLQVLIEDSYGNPVPKVSVNFSDGGAGGSFSPDPAVTNAKGIASGRYTASATTGKVTITASAPGLPPVGFTVNVD